MSDEETTRPKGSKLQALYGGDVEHRIELMGPRDAHIGVFVTFDSGDGATSMEWNRILERAVQRGAKKSGYDDACAMIFRRKVLAREERGAVAIEGLSEDDCEGMKPSKFLASNSANARHILRVLVNEYNERTGIAANSESEEDSKN